MRIERRFTKAGQDVYTDVEFRRTTSEIRNPDGSVVFQADDVHVPASWSQVACDILAQKYFRKRGVPKESRRVEEAGVPEWLRPDPGEVLVLPGKREIDSAASIVGWGCDDAVWRDVLRGGPGTEQAHRQSANRVSESGHGATSGQQGLQYLNTR